MSILQVVLFGGVRMTHDSWLTEVFLTREIQSLLAYLLLHRRRVHAREVLAGVFWGEHSQEKARGSLNTALWKLKKVLEPEGIPPGTYLTSSPPGKVGFNTDSRYWLDVEEFESQASRILAQPIQEADDTSVVKLESALELHRAELLEGFYDEWAVREREHLRAIYLRSLIFLFQYYGLHHAYDKAILLGQKVLEVDPLREEIHREMMRLYLEIGKRDLALRQYDLCRAVVGKEFGLPPMDETEALHSQILANSLVSPHPVIPGDAAVASAIGRLEEAGKAVELAREQIQQALEMISSLSNSESEHPVHIREER